MDTRPLQQSVRSSRGSAEETTARANEEADPNIEDLPEPKHAAWEATVVDCDKEKDEEDREQGEKDKSAFAAARKGHYNEMALVRQMMAARALEEDEDDSDDEDEEQEAEAEEEEDTAELESSVAANNGGWAAGPDALHGLPKAAAGGATSIPVYSKVRELSTSPDLESSVIVPDPLRCSYVVKNDRRQKHVAWDEATLAEHDLERGTRQKIEEPNTPWMGSPQMSNENSPVLVGTPEEPLEPSEATDGIISPTRLALDGADMQERLQAWYRKEKHRPSIQERWDIAFAQPEEDADKSSSFADKRKQHYNEMNLVRWAKAEIEEEESDDEDEKAGDKPHDDGGGKKRCAGESMPVAHATKDAD